MPEKKPKKEESGIMAYLKGMLAPSPEMQQDSKKMLEDIEGEGDVDQYGNVIVKKRRGKYGT